jgi:hypothetical protein
MLGITTLSTIHNGIKNKLLCVLLLITYLKSNFLFMFAILQCNAFNISPARQ